MRPVRQFWDNAGGAGNYQAGTANAQNRISLAGATGVCWVLGKVWWSTSGGTPATTVTIETSPDNSSWTVVFSQDITAAGPGWFEPIIPRAALEGSYVRVTMAAAGSGVSSKLWVDAWKENARAPAY